MDSGIIFMIFLLIFLIVMFIIEPIRIDIIALSVPVILVFTNYWTGVTPIEAISGFSSSATVTIGSMFIISAGVEKSGIIQALGDKIDKWTGDSDFKLLFFIILFAGIIAGFINNTPVVALFIPLVIGISKRKNSSPSKFLIPLSYAAMMGGLTTLIGTSTNILASDILARRTGEGFSMFEFTHLGLLVLFIGAIYMLVLGRKILPERIKPEVEVTEKFDVGKYLTETAIREDSPLIGKTMEEAENLIDFELNIIQLHRSGKKFLKPLINKIIQAGDHLIVRTDPENLVQLIKAHKMKIISKTPTRKNLNIEKGSQNMVEIVLPYGCILEGQTLEESKFLENYDCDILAIRQGEKLNHKRMINIPLKVGDVLLLTAGEKTIERLRKDSSFIISSEIGGKEYRPSKVITSLAILAGVILLAALKIVPIAISSLGGVIAMVITKSLKPVELSEAINWNVIFLLAGLIPLGIAMDNTGTARFMASQILQLEGILSPVLFLMIFYLFTMIFANLIGNNASVILMLPIALDAAGQLGLNPIAFAIAVTFAASSAFLTPMSYQTNMMVYGPGGYKFQDFFWTGLPLQLMLLGIVPLLIKLFWGL
ncbi:MAG: SLC13 family permease [Fusobacteriota bacterium]